MPIHPTLMIWIVGSTSLKKKVDIDDAMQQYILQHRSAFYFEDKIQKLKPKLK